MARDRLLTFKVPEDMAQELDRLASEMGTSRSAVIRLALSLGLQAVKAMDSPCWGHGFRCPFCGRSFCGFNTLRSHVLEEHARKLDYYVCPACGAQFRSRLALARHAAALAGDGLHDVVYAAVTTMKKHTGKWLKIVRTARQLTMDDPEGDNDLPRVILLEVSNPCLALLAVKVSQGKIVVRPLDRYWPRCDWGKLRYWMLEAAEKFPSVLEHVKITWLIDGVSRVFTHQLVRHRIASYTQESQRYSEYRIVRCLECLSELYCSSTSSCSEKRLVGGFNADPWRWWATALRALLESGPPENMLHCLEECLRIPDRRSVPHLLGALLAYAEARARGLPPEEARYLLPQATRTAILVTMNLREFLHVYRLRSSPAAQPETREIVEKMMDELARVLPWARELAARYRG